MILKFSHSLALMLSAGLLASSGAAHAALAVYPQAIQLDNARDPERVIAVVTREDGVTLDVTGQAQIALENPALATWGEDFRLHPAADGETNAVITYEGESVTVPVVVRNAAVNPPMSFRNDLQPVIMRANCNGGACHGSAKGKNGFHLSLFGYDPSIDFLSLSREVRSRRINIAIPEESLMLSKPTGEVDHEGGTVITRGDALYETMHRWIAEGAQDDPAEVPTLASIDILPPEAVLEGEGAVQRFTVRARYSDGTDRDVTELAILSASDESTLKVDAKGVATAGTRGEVYVMARFGTFAVVSKAIVIPAGMTLPWPEDAVEKNFVDTHVFAKLKKLRVPPAENSSDAIFLRRAYIDILGVLPSVEDARAFLDDPAPDKRAKLIDALLERPEFNDVWAMKWAEILRVATGAQVLDAKGMHRYNDWLRQKISSNTPMDQIVRELLTAEGGNFTNPATNFYLVEADPKIMAENVAQVFTGIQLKCAQCHNHPFERWTMDDYYSFSAFFSQVGRKASSDPREQIIFNRGSGEVANLRDGRNMAPKFLGGAVPDTTGKDRRVLLAEWLTSPENPWFAQNIANRVWAHFFGAGIVDPPDDVRVSNPPSNPQLLEELGRRMVEYKYDLRTLVRDICNSYAYQMSTRPREEGINDTRNFAYAQVRRLTAEQMLDAIAQVTQTKVKFPNLPLGARAAQVANGPSGIYFLEVFGRPTRETVCTCERRGEPNLAQSLHLINGDTIQGAITNGEGRLAKLLAAEKPVPEVAQELYMAALSRPPSEEEVKRLEDYVGASEDKRLALEDAFWAVLNSKEFTFNH
jgi:hypothetical protein